jgi:hypothetical protein
VEHLPSYAWRLVVEMRSAVGLVTFNNLDERREARHHADASKPFEALRSFSKGSLEGFTLVKYVILEPTRGQYMRL